MWFKKIARTEVERITRNILRLETLRSTVHDLSNFVVSSNSGGYEVLKGLLEDKIVLGRPMVYAKLQSALVGENNQKLALDAPMKFQSIMVDAEKLIIGEINKERRELRKLKSDQEDGKTD